MESSSKGSITSVNLSQAVPKRPIGESVCRFSLRRMLGVMPGGGLT
jgi:hypothetical protein